MMTIEEKLDYILAYHRDVTEQISDGTYLGSDDEVKREQLVKLVSNNQGGIYESYMKYLREGGYIVNDNSGRYILSVQGLVFEGFVERNRRIQEERNRITNLEIDQLELARQANRVNRRLQYLTGGLLICAALPAVYSAIEIFKFVYSCWIARH